MNKIILLFFLFFMNYMCRAQNGFGEFSRIEFNVKSDNDAEELNFFTYLFETKNQLTGFLDIRKGDIVAEIGAADGINIGVMSLVLDSVTFVAQDIDAKSLNEKSYQKVISKYQKKRSSPQTNTFKMAIGTKDSSGLRDNYFDEIVVINSFHDFDKQEAMLNDIYRKLKPSGRFILLEGFSFPGDTQVCPDYGPHILHTLDVDLATFENHGFYLSKMRAPYFKAAHYGNGLIFVKDKQKSDAFYKVKNEIDETVSHAFRFKQAAVAGDSMIVKQITDSILPEINKVTGVYTVFEAWMKELGFRHLQKSDHTAAINVFKANTRFFPGSYQAFYWLGMAYERSGSYELALENYDASLRLNPFNSLCPGKIKELKKLQKSGK